MGGPRAATRPYDLRRLSTPGIPRVRQAHRAVLPRAGFHVRPGWVAGGLLVGALLSTGMVAGSTGMAAPAGAEPASSVVAAHAAVPGLGTPGPGGAQFSFAVSVLPSATPAPTRSALLGPSGGVPGTEAPVRRPMLASVKSGAAMSRGVATATPRAIATPGPAATTGPAASPHATATSHPATSSATPRPKATPRATPATVTESSASTAATPKPRPSPTPKPVPAIVYLHHVSGRATWGDFGGAVITRLLPGTRIKVCGRLGCWEGVSTGYGPSPDGGNLVDLDAAIFRRINGPLSTGVGDVVLSWR
jgi:hypothetical protein